MRASFSRWWVGLAALVLVLHANAGLAGGAESATREAQIFFSPG